MKIEARAFGSDAGTTCDLAAGGSPYLSKSGAQFDDGAKALVRSLERKLLAGSYVAIGLLILVCFMVVASHIDV